MTRETTVPLVDLRASFPPIRDEVMAAFESVLGEMHLFLGPNLEAFEREFGSYCGAADGIAVSSGTDALAAALEACGIGPGDEVIVPSHTFFASVEAIVRAGATPVLVDVEDSRLTIDVEEVRRAVTRATRAIMPVHLYGQPVDMDPLLELAREHALVVIEDAAQAHGARYKGRRCGAIGDAGCFSFYFTKNLGAYGEGGFVTTSRDDVAERVRLLRNHGRISKYDHAEIGSNLRLDELQAALLRIRLRRLDAANERRREVAARYAERLVPAVRLLGERADCEPVWHVFPIRVPDRDGLAKYLDDCGIGTGIHYRVPAHRQPALHGRPHRAGPLPVTDAACAELLSLPMYPEITDDQVDYVSEHVLRYVDGRGGAAATARS